MRHNRKIFLLALLIANATLFFSDGMFSTLQATEWEISYIEQTQDFLRSSIKFTSSGSYYIAYGGDNLYLIKAVRLGSTWYFLESVVDDTPGTRVGDYCSLALDSSDNPRISYYDESNRALKYASWNGSAWEIETVDSEGYDVGKYSSLALDSNGYPNISYWYETGFKVKYASWNGSSWDIEILPTSTSPTDSVGWTTSLALDSNDYPQISFTNSTDDVVEFAWWDGSHWDFRIIPVSGSGMSSLALDNNGYPRISFSAGSLRYAWWDGANWQYNPPESSVGNSSRYSSLALTKINYYPRISYYDFNNKDLKYASWDGSDWDINVVDSDGDVGLHTALALSSSGNPRISYYDYNKNRLKLAFHNGLFWSKSQLASSSGINDRVSLVLDSNGYPRVSYYDEIKGDLKYAAWNGSSWDVETIDSDGNVGQYSSLYLDNSNKPQVSYFDETNHDLKYASWNGSSWDIQVVDDNTYTGYTSLVLDSNGNPRVSYRPLSKGLKYASWDSLTETWDKEIVTDEGDVLYSSMALDQNDHPRISYYDDENDDLKYAVWNSTEKKWDIETVDEDGRVGEYNSLVIDSNGYPAISYYDYTNDVLKYASWNGSAWIKETVDGDAGLYTSLALNGNGLPSISYYSTSIYVDEEFYFGNIKFASWDGTKWDVETVDKELGFNHGGQSTFLGFDIQNNITIVYLDEAKKDLKIARKEADIDVEDDHSFPWLLFVPATTNSRR